MTYTEKRLEDTIDNEMAYLWSAIEENLPKSQEMEALGQEKIFRAVKAGYISYRPIFIAQAIAEERVKIRKEITVIFSTADRTALLTELREWSEEEPTINGMMLKARLLARIDELINPSV